MSDPTNSEKFIRVDRTDFDFRKGYFFEMLVDYHTSITGQIQDESRIGDVGRCSQRRTCQKYLILRPLIVQLYMPPKDIFQCSDETQSALVVSDRLLKALQQAGITGFRREPVEVVDTPLGSVPPGQTYHQLAVVGFKASFVETVHGCENVCPHCGKAPIVCEESCEWNWYCPVCHKETMFIKGLSRPWPKGEPDPRIPVLGNPKLDAQRCARVEGRRWKGEDMIFRASCAEQGHLLPQIIIVSPREPELTYLLAVLPSFPSRSWGV